MAVAKTGRALPSWGCQSNGGGSQETRRLQAHAGSCWVATQAEGDKKEGMVSEVLPHEGSRPILDLGMSRYKGPEAGVSRHGAMTVTDLLGTFCAQNVLETSETSSYLILTQP